MVAFIVPVAGQSIAPEHLDALCLDRIARFKRPKAYFFTEDLPRNAMGKVTQPAVRELFSARGRVD